MAGKKWSLEISVRACNIYMGANDGVTIIQFNGTDNLVPNAREKINGVGPTFSPRDLAKCAVIQYAMTYSSDSNTMEQTIAHEIGHNMFLPHAPLGARLPDGLSRRADR